jgi:hypothetical protein
MTWEQKFGLDSARLGFNPKAEQHGNLRSTSMKGVEYANQL